MRVLVCGGREFDNWERLKNALDAYDDVDAIIEGGAKGADFLGRVWGRLHDIPVEEYPADWRKHGKKAGAIRNQQMLDEGSPDVVLAFPGGFGTADMVRRAEAAGVPVFKK